ncbi:MAG: TVP38/TMEM64 family protein [Planctomycetaceae bacterium]|nr:TVP38/TMEM64 family protein [Planctomycetaceae bacterium]
MSGDTTSRTGVKLLIATVVIVLMPLLVLGFGFEDHLGDYFAQTVEPTTFAAATIAVLAVDVFLPVPSSLVNTLAGSRLGIVGGTVVAWLGMNLGAIIAFTLAKFLGRPLVQRLTRADDVARLEQLAEQRGVGLLIATRALPVLAEATVLLVGSLGVTWRAFLPPVLLANLGLSLAYAVFGHYAMQHGLLSTALVASIALPLLATYLARRWWR